jgi:hypothetical protein
MRSDWTRVEKLVAPHQAELQRVAVSQTEIRVVTCAIVHTDDLLKEQRSSIHDTDDSLGIAIIPCFAILQRGSEAPKQPCLPNFSNF